VVDAQVVTRRDTFAGRITLLYGHFNGVGIYLIDAPHLYDRPGSPYHDTNQHAYTDNVLRFALLGWVGSEMASGLDPFWRPDVVHAHDWHAGLTPAYLAARGRPAKSVFTVHNLAYQGMFYSWHMNDIELPWSFYNMHGLEFNGQISFLKAGLYYADHITAVSPTYAREITEPQYAYGMEGCCASAIMKDGCREFSTALTTVSGARKTICCCRCATIATRWRRRRRTSVSCRLPWA
jgi:starch synthase